MTELGTPQPETSAAPEDRDRIRVASLSGTVGALAIIVAFFLPWVSVEEQIAQDFAAKVATHLEEELATTPATREDWRRLAEDLAENKYVTGLDVFYWARTAYRHRTHERALSGGTDTSVAARAIRLSAIWLAALPALALLLAIYFIVHHFRRARSPALILAMLVGAAAITTTAVHGIVHGAIDEETEAGIGLSVLLAGGALLFLAGTFGVKARNWWRVFGGALLVGGIVVLGILSYLREAPRP